MSKNILSHLRLSKNNNKYTTSYTKFSILKKEIKDKKMFPIPPPLLKNLFYKESNEWFTQWIKSFWGGVVDSGHICVISKK